MCRFKGVNMQTCYVVKTKDCWYFSRSGEWLRFSSDRENSIRYEDKWYAQRVAEALCEKMTSEELAQIGKPFASKARLGGKVVTMPLAGVKRVLSGKRNAAGLYPWE